MVPLSLFDSVAVEEHRRAIEEHRRAVEELFSFPLVLQKVLNRRNDAESLFQLCPL